MPQKYMFTNEQSLRLCYEREIQAFWRDNVTQGKFDGVDNVAIAYAYALNPDAVGTIVISSGRIETFLKYKEAIYDLFQNGYSVFIHDHRGQGLSGRMLANSHMGYVDSFNDYIDDFKKFMGEVVGRNSQHKPYLLCHSMGSAIGAQLVIDSPDMFKKVVFSAPMFGIRPALPDWLAQLLLSTHFGFCKLARKTESYFFGQKDYANRPFENNDLTQSEVRYQIFRYEYNTNPLVKLGGVTGKWLLEASKTMDYIEDEASQFPIPAMVFQASADTVVDNKRQARVAKKMANTSLKIINGARHELLEEQDVYRDNFLTQTLDFFGS